MRLSSTISLIIVLLVLAGCGLTAQGPPPETQICQGWWQWEEKTLDGSPLGSQGVDSQGLSLADCVAARGRNLEAWRELYTYTPHTAGECECKDIPPPARPDLVRLREAQTRLHQLHERVNATLDAYSDMVNDDFQVQVRSVQDLEGFSLALKRHEGPRFESAQYVLAMGEIYQEVRYLDDVLHDMHAKPLRQVDILVDRALTSLGRLEQREASLERQFKAYYAVEKYWFGVDEDGVLAGPFHSQEAVRAGRVVRLRFVWYLYRPSERNPFLFFEDKQQCEAGRNFWQGTACGTAPTSDLETDALRRGDRVDFKRTVYEKYRLEPGK